MANSRHAHDQLSNGKAQCPVILCTKFVEYTSNMFSDIVQKHLCHLENTLKVTRFEPGAYMAYFLGYAVILNDCCDLENKLKVKWFKLGLCHALVLPCTKFCEHT